MEQPLQSHEEERKLTPAQMKAEAAHFTEEYIQRQLATEPVDEQQAEVFLRQAYAAVGLDPPLRVFWLDGPHQLIALLTSDDDWVSAEERFINIPEAIRDSLKDSDEIGPIKDKSSVLNSIDEKITSGMQESVEARLPKDFKPYYYSKGLGWFVSLEVRWNIRESVRDRIGRRIWDSLGGGDTIRYSELSSIKEGIYTDAALNYSRWYSMRAYDEASDLACLHFYDTYFAPNEAHGLTHFNQMVSGYWLGKEVALVVRRPKALALDEAGRLHSATGKAIAYHDGWGFYAWHGVQVDEKVILAPETLTREDFLGGRNVEARRVIQERMGERFVWELEGTYIDGGPRGVLYEVTLPRDPERVARYVQVQDASTDHYYVLRVPPTIQTVAEAIAWTFGLSLEEYHPAQET
ncbi:MAG TPA: hypothetical protein VKT82_09715 [Ktedonobacterales bacterium]|nr:hypothetical protein [Ktedonobacterales bacterium]